MVEVIPHLCVCEKERHRLLHMKCYSYKAGLAWLSPDYSTQQPIGETQQNKSQRKYPSVNFTRESLTSFLILTPPPPTHDSSSEVTMKVHHIYSSSIFFKTSAVDEQKLRRINHPPPVIQKISCAWWSLVSGKNGMKIGFLCTKIHCIVDQRRIKINIWNIKMYIQIRAARWRSG